MDDISGVFKEPFKEQVAFFRNKLQELRPTTSSTDPDYQKAAHDKAFMVAGAQKADLLSDFAAAVDKAIAQGTGLGEFQKDFDKIVDGHGWAHTGDRNWRSRVIYNTNLSTSYAAGRLAQIHEAGFSYMTYKHSRTVENPRLAHVALDGTTLPIDDPFWDTHYPPNGWGCQCRVVGINRPSDASRYADDPKYTAPRLERDPVTGLPQGVSKGWDYKPGGTVIDTVRALSQVGQRWPRDISVAYMNDVPEGIKDDFSDSYRSLKSVEDEVEKVFVQATENINLSKVTTLGLVRSDQVVEIKKMKFIQSDDDLQSEIDAVLKHNKKVQKKIRLGTATQKDKLRDIPERIELENQDVSGLDFSITGDAVRHVWKGHGVTSSQNKGEKVNSHKPVEATDFKKIPHILSEYDSMTAGGIAKKSKKAVIIFQKREENLNYVLHMEISPGDKAKSLRLKTFRIEERKK